MNDFDMLIKTSRFYEKESKRLLKKLNRSSTEEQKLAALTELKSLKQKIKFEINEISKIIQQNEEY
jgi:4-diphosphocytidyl-2C-methyl-D-erythritol kinase